MSHDLNSKLGIHRLNEEERKRLFQKFIDAGGKVMDDKKGSVLQFDREKQKDLLKKLKEKDRKRRDGPASDIWEEEYASFQTAAGKSMSFWNRLKLHMRGFFHQVTDLTRERIADSFFRFFKAQVVPNLKNFNFIVQYIFSAGEENLKEVKKILDAREPYYFPLLEKYRDFFNEEEYNAVLYFSNRRRFSLVRPRYLEEPLKKIFKKIYILKGYQNGSLQAFKNALYVTSRNKVWEERLYQKRLNQVKYSLNLIFLHLMPKLHVLSLFILREIVPLSSRKLESFLGLEERDRVTYLLDKKEKESGLPLPEMPLRFKTVKTEEIKFVPKNFSELTDDDFRKLDLDTITVLGIKLMQCVDMEGVIQGHRELFKLDKASREDKVFLIFVYFKEFEKEYSFLLTSYKVVIRPLFEENKRINYKDKLNSLYTPITGFNVLFKDYFDIIHEIQEIKEDAVMNEITRYNRMTALEGKRSKLGYEIKNDMVKHLTELKLNLDKFINDYNGEKRIIENPDDDLHFNIEVEGVKKVEGKRIIDAVIEIDAFVSAFLFRLNEGGDLLGLSSELKQIEVPDIPAEAPPAAAVPPSGPAAEEAGDNFLDELSYTLDKRLESKKD